jgi:chromosome segregation ATPase
MKKFLQYILLIILLSVFGIILTNRDQARQAVQEVKTAAQKELGVDQPCGKPLEYSIGNIDQKFNISQNDLAQLAQLATQVWNKADGKNLLEYNPDSQFKINLVYDSRQEQSDAASQLEQNLQNLESSNNSLTKKYNSLSSAYKQKIDAYNKDLENYKSDVDKFNSDVRYWNSQGGAPADEYLKLQKEKSNLDDEYKNLDQERQDVNKLAGLTNNIVSQENQTVANYNSNVETYQSQYGGTQEFEKGVFDGTEIDIYEFRAKTDLELTLIHEFGHYLGLEHTQDPKSIMYSMIGEQNMENPTLAADDINELKNICK